jgi:hypothetical protein
MEEETKVVVATTDVGVVEIINNPGIGNQEKIIETVVNGAIENVAGLKLHQNRLPLRLQSKM